MASRCPEALAAARWATAHLPEEAIHGPLDEDQRAHVAACARCRTWRRLLAFHG